MLTERQETAGASHPSVVLSKGCDSAMEESGARHLDNLAGVDTDHFLGKLAKLLQK